MVYIDKYAYMSRLNKQNPLYKLFFCLLTLCVCVWANSIIVSLVIITIMGWYTVFKGSIPVSVFLKMMIIPICFLFVGVLTIGITFSENQSSFIFSIFAFKTNIGVTSLGILNATHTFFKSLGAVSCLYYLSLNTPMVDILYAFSKLKIPKLFIELMGLIYRFIFLLLEIVNIMINAQKSRMGYSSITSSYRSFSILVSTLFIRSYRKSDALYTSLEARGYDGELNVLNEIAEISRRQYIIPITINVALIVITLIIRRFTGGLL